MPDPLDSKIDDHLSSQPLQSDDAFTARVLEAVETDASRRQRRLSPSVIKFALPLAAAIALAAVWLTLTTDTTQARQTALLSPSETGEILELENALDGLADIEPSAFQTDGLVDTLEILYLEI